MDVLVLLSRLPDVPGSDAGGRAGSLLRALHETGARSHVMALRRSGGAEDRAEAACAALSASLETFDLPWSGPLLGALELARGGSYCMGRHRCGDLRRRSERVIERERCAAVICVGVEMAPHVPARPPFYVLDLGRRASRAAAERGRTAPPPRRFWHLAEAAALRDIEADQVHRANLSLLAEDEDAASIARRNPRRQVLCMPAAPTPADWRPIIELLGAAARDPGRRCPVESSARRIASPLTD